MFKTGLIILLALCAAMLRANPADDFQKKIHPLFEKYCFSCHNPEKHKGDLNLKSFETFDQVKAARDTFHTVLERVAAFEMPPEGKKAPSFDEQHQLVAWLRTLPQPEKSADADCDQIASDRNAGYFRGYVMSRRINRAEYANTVCDLFGVSVDVESLLPADGGGGEGFDTAGSALFTSSIHIEKYLAAADFVLKTVLPDKAGSTSAREARRKILGSAGLPANAVARNRAREVVARYSRLAWRRPVTAEEVDHSMRMFDRAWERGDGYVPSLRLALKSLLVSPNFLFLAEPEPEEKGIQPLAAVPLASKLSYFLWSSMPDEELLGLAESGQLLDPNIYREQIQRLLASPKARALGERFAVQWLDLDRLGSEVKPDPTRFPEFDSELRKAMVEEAVAKFNYIVTADHSILELIDSNYTFVNEKLARLYGIPNITGREFQIVTLTDTNRGGITGMAAIHALTSFPLRTSPVLRGKWVLESLLGEKVKPPPPGTPPLEDTASKHKEVSLRAQLQIHRANPECASCHDKMDPLGFGLENFDVLGRWREVERGMPIDASGKLPSGETFTGPAGLKKILMERKDTIVRNIVRKMTGYAFGRELNRYDECVVKRTMEAMKTNDYRPSVMIEQIAMSFPFRHRFYPKILEAAAATSAGAN